MTGFKLKSNTGLKWVKKVEEKPPSIVHAEKAY